MEEALKHSGENYNITVPIHNALGALGKTDAAKRTIFIARSPSTRRT